AAVLPSAATCLTTVSALLPAVGPGSTYALSLMSPDVDARAQIAVCVLADWGIWGFDRAQNRFVWLVAAPPEKRAGHVKDMVLAMTRGSLWLGTRDAGLWEYPREPGAAQREWQRLVEDDGLPSRQITAIAPLENDGVAVFTRSGHCFVRKDAWDAWRIDG